jgi:hypothetical protein
LVITGAPGAGKTVLEIELTLRLIEVREPDDAVPVRVPTSDPSLVLVPSLEEGFGLVRMEAIAGGIPMLVSGRCGLGLLLEEVLSGAGPAGRGARA